jgi:hypothetical protein
MRSCSKAYPTCMFQYDDKGGYRSCMRMLVTTEKHDRMQKQCKSN